MIRWSWLILLFLLPGCKREERPLRVEPSATDVARKVEISEVVPGLPPTTQAALSQDIKLDKNDYEKSAFLLSEGQRLYKSFNCKGCHASGGGGDIGPALIDDEWLYGYEPQQVYASIVQGRPNGMPAYGRRITEHQAWELTAYVRSMSGQVSQSAAPGRADHSRTAPPPNRIDPVQPKNTGESKSGEKPK
jgi:cytochrome c oxidase cbb3-type subunit III